MGSAAGLEPRMKIDGPNPIRLNTVRRAERSGKAGDSAFASQLASEEAAAGAVGSPALIGQIDAVLALQEVSDATHGRGRAVRRGHDLLDRLDEIRHGLLIGAIPERRLKALGRALKAERQRTGDPGLAEVIGEIELRCAVELAKLGVGSDNL